MGGGREGANMTGWDSSGRLMNREVMEAAQAARGRGRGGRREPYEYNPFFISSNTELPA